MMLASREVKDTTRLPDTDNKGVEIFFLSSFALISNTGLIKAEALTGKPN